MSPHPKKPTIILSNDKFMALINDMQQWPSMVSSLLKALPDFM
jgi:hypothetical protein